MTGILVLMKTAGLRTTHTSWILEQRQEGLHVLGDVDEAAESTVFQDF